MTEPSARRVSSHCVTSAPMGSSSATRCPASANRWTLAWGARSSRSARKRSWKTGSFPPQMRSTGTARDRSASKFDAARSSAVNDVSLDFTGISATKPATAARRSVDRYGALSAFRCERSVICEVPRTNNGVRAQVRLMALLATAMSGGTETDAGLATAVLVRTTARTSSSPAAPMATGPPQSWAAMMSGPGASCRQNTTSSSTRCSKVREPALCDQPMPV